MLVGLTFLAVIFQFWSFGEGASQTGTEVAALENTRGVTARDRAVRQHQAAQAALGRQEVEQIRLTERNRNVPPPLWGMSDEQLAEHQRGIEWDKGDAPSPLQGGNRKALAASSGLEVPPGWRPPRKSMKEETLEAFSANTVSVTVEESPRFDEDAAHQLQSGLYHRAQPVAGGSQAIAGIETVGGASGNEPLAVEAPAAPSARWPGHRNPRRQRPHRLMV